MKRIVTVREKPEQTLNFFSVIHCITYLVFSIHIGVKS
jgi:hypothetical protein